LSAGLLLSRQLQRTGLGSRPVESRRDGTVSRSAGVKKQSRPSSQFWMPAFLFDFAAIAGENRCEPTNQPR
jgi:hypothetical protein